jgi:hypothetical protein
MTIRKKEVVLPIGVQAIGLSEQQAAAYWGITPSLFARLEREQNHCFPRPRKAGDRKLYSRIELEEKFHQLPYWDDDGDCNDDWGVN